jgi:nucleotide-binding universal stress UspA family protein
MFQRILVPTDGSEITGRAVSTAIGLAKSLGAEVFTLCVKEPFPYGAVAEMQPTPPQEFFDAQERTATRNVQAVVQACEAAGITCHAQTVEGVQPWEAIVAHAAEQRCDLLVMGSHGRSGLASLFLGSETNDVLKHTTVPVLVVR